MAMLNNQRVTPRFCWTPITARSNLLRSQRFSCAQIPGANRDQGDVLFYLGGMN